MGDAARYPNQLRVGILDERRRRDLFKLIATYAALI
jgi:hypothetical protein